MGRITVTDDKQVPGTPSGTPGKPAGSSGTPDAGAPKATDLEALRAKLGFKPGAAAPAPTPGAPKPGPRPAVPGTPGSAPASSQAPSSKPAGIADFTFGGPEDSKVAARPLTAKELEELDKSMAKASKPLSHRLIVAGVVLVVLFAAIWIGLQMGKGMSGRDQANKAITQAQAVKNYFAKNVTVGQGTDMAVRGEAAAKLKDGLTEYMNQNQEFLTGLSEYAGSGRLPDDFAWDEFKKMQLAPLKLLLTTYLETAPTYQIEEILGGEIYAPDLAAELTTFVGRANTLRASVEQLLLTVEMLMNDITPPKAMPAGAELPGKTAYLFAPNVDRAGTEILDAALVKVAGEIADNKLHTTKTKKTVEKEEKCVKAPIEFEWSCTPCKPGAKPEMGKQEIPTYDLQVAERTVEVPVAEIASLADGKKREVEMKHLYAVDMRPFVKPIVDRLQELADRVTQDDASLHGAATAALRIFFGRLEQVQTEAGTVDLKSLMDLVEATASQEEQFVL